MQIKFANYILVSSSRIQIPISVLSSKKFESYVFHKAY